jgi:hypothetical protein
VLAVDGQDAASPPLLGGERDLPGRDEALLVREREVDAVLERPDRRGQPGEADDRVEDDVGLGLLEKLRQVAAHLRERREPVDRLRARGGRGKLEAGVAVDDLEGLPADRARGPEKRYSLHATQSRAATPASRAAMTRCLAPGRVPRSH